MASAMRTARSVGFGHRHGIVEEHHQPVAGKAFQRAFVRLDQPPHRGVVIAQHAHHFFRFRRLGEAREAAQIEKHHRHFAAVAQERILGVAGDDQFCELRRHEPLQARQALQLLDLIGHAALQFAVPLRQLCRLCFEPRGLLLDLIVERLDTEHRFDPRHQCGLIDGLREVFVGARFEPGDDIL